jgi:glycosyltransferase involved in cell wall biosynthesis
MTDSSLKPARVRVDGKFFRLGADKFFVKGVTYGPFAPNAHGEMFPVPDQARRDLAQIQSLGANVLRVYYVPPRWFLDLLAEHGLKVLIDIPWAKHLCFLDSADSQDEARRQVRDAVAASNGHPAVFAFSVVNEISAEIVRWSGVRRVQRFINQLVDEAKAIDSHCLCTFTSFPPTEFLQAESIDFICFNVYLHEPGRFESYLARLQTLADAKPLVLGEFGMDSIREGESRKCEFLNWQIELAFRSGLAGTVVFSYTDDWFRGGLQIEDWGFGLTTRDRKPKESFEVVRRQYQAAPYFPLPRVPKASVVVATFNGARTLRQCLESLARLNYQDYEVLLVDDGSTDPTPDIAKSFPSIRYIRQTNQGLSAARNAGIRAARGEIIAFTDDDCRADEDWLYYLVNDLLRSDCAGIGGHNFLPPDDSCVAAAVVVSPGGPAHVMLTDREAEHIPGCNMAFYKWALEQIGLFDPVFRKAGDDVDICWRLQDGRFKIGFSPAGFVWHYRRATVKAYLKQQSGYGEAEALLVGKHPEHYNLLGGGIWRGRIYASSFSGLLLRPAVIYHGIFGSGFFQRLYEPNPVSPLMFSTSLAYHVCLSAPLLLLAFYFRHIAPLAIVSLALSAGSCLLAAAQAKLPRTKKRFWSRPLVALLFFLQPVIRGWARFKWRFTLLAAHRSVSLEPPEWPADKDPPATMAFWSDRGTDRYQFLESILRQLARSGCPYRTDTGWTAYDVEVQPHLWTQLRLTTVTEDLEQGKKSLHCRIQTSWALPARILMAVAALVMAFLLGYLAEQHPWTWMALLALPLLLWILEDRAMQEQRKFAALITRAASELSLVRPN